MRAMVIPPGPAFSVADVSRGWVGALKELGVETVDLNFDTRLTFYERAANVATDWVDLDEIERFQRVMQLAVHSVKADVYDFWPDVIFVISGFYIPHEFYGHLRGRGHKVVLVCTESPYEDDRQLARAALVDHVILNDPTNIEKFLETNPNTIYLPHCYDPAIHKPGPPDPELASDFAFVGTGYPSRIEFFERVDWDGIEAKFGGNWQTVTDDSPLFPKLIHERQACLPNEDAVEFYRSAKVSANLYRKEATQAALVDGWSMGPREVELAATETMFVREPRGEGDEIFPFLPTFFDPEDFGELVRYYLKNDDERQNLAEKAHAAIADRTFTENAKKLLARL